MLPLGRITAQAKKPGLRKVGVLLRGQIAPAWAPADRVLPRSLVMVEDLGHHHRDSDRAWATPKWLPKICTGQAVWGTAFSVAQPSPVNFGSILRVRTLRVWRTAWHGRQDHVLSNFIKRR